MVGGEHRVVTMKNLASCPAIIPGAVAVMNRRYTILGFDGILLAYPRNSSELPFLCISDYYYVKTLKDGISGLSLQLVNITQELKVSEGILCDALVGSHTRIP